MMLSAIRYAAFTPTTWSNSTGPGCLLYTLDTPETAKEQQRLALGKASRQKRAGGAKLRQPLLKTIITMRVGPRGEPVGENFRRMVRGVKKPWNQFPFLVEWSVPGAENSWVPFSRVERKDQLNEFGQLIRSGVNPSSKPSVSATCSSQILSLIYNFLYFLFTARLLCVTSAALLVRSFMLRLRAGAVLPHSGWGTVASCHISQGPTAGYP